MKKIIVGCVLASLAGCAGVSNKPEVPVLNSFKSNEIVDEVVVSETVEKKTAISSNTLFLLMVADIAGQRQQYDVALEAYLQAAKQENDVRLSERAAKIGLFLKDVDRTNEAVSLWLKNDNHNLTARKIAVISALRGGDLDQAVTHLEGLLLDDPAGFEDNLIEFSQLLGKEKSSRLVFSALEQLTIQYPKTASIFFVQALLSEGNNEFEIAQAKLEQALLIQPNWTKALIFSAKLAAKLGDLEESKNILNKVLVTTPHDLKIHRLLARVLVQLKDYEAARAIYSAMFTENNEDYASKFAIGLIYLQEKKPTKARNILQDLVNIPRWDKPAYYYLGRIDFQEKEYQSALGWLEKVSTGDYAYDAISMSISIELQQKEFGEAEKKIAKLYKAFPKQASRIDFLQVDILSMQKKYQQAFDFLTEKLKQRPDSRDLLYSRALMAEKLNRLGVLEIDLKNIISQFPNDASALNALGYTLADRTERYQDAEIYLEQAIKLKPDEAVIIDSMGWLRFKQGQISQALVYLRDAYKKQPESEIAAHLAEVLWGLSNKSEAQAIFDKAIQKNPNDEYLLKFQQQFLVQ